MVELQHGLPIKVVQSDWGGAFRPFTSFLTEYGILHRVIYPHTHHQNGVVQRKHRHIVEIGLTLFSQASLPLTYWDYAFSPTVYLINRLPSASLKFQVPFQVLFKSKPVYLINRLLSASLKFQVLFRFSLSLNLIITFLGCLDVHASLF